MEPKLVRAKFLCTSVTKTTGYPSGFQWTYRFSAVTSGSKENETFWRYTPSGSIELAALREDLFEIGKEYYVDFTMFVPTPAPAQELK